MNDLDCLLACAENPVILPVSMIKEHTGERWDRTQESFFPECEMNPGELKKRMRNDTAQKMKDHSAFSRIIE